MIIVLVYLMRRSRYKWQVITKMTIKVNEKYIISLGVDMITPPPDAHH
jgi:hypothetical protein